MKTVDGSLERLRKLASGIRIAGGNIERMCDEIEQANDKEIRVPDILDQALTVMNLASYLDEASAEHREVAHEHEMQKLMRVDSDPTGLAYKGTL